LDRVQKGGRMTLRFTRLLFCLVILTARVYWFRAFRALKWARNSEVLFENRIGTEDRPSFCPMLRRAGDGPGFALNQKRSRATPRRAGNRTRRTSWTCRTGRTRRRGALERRRAVSTAKGEAKQSQTSVGLRLPRPPNDGGLAMTPKQARQRRGKLRG
jgi:hypothetical protein